MKNKQIGDTIVEVMIAILIAGVALGAAYQLSNASLKTSTQASQRSQALSFSSAQIERMKALFLQDSSSFISTYENTSPGQDDFCVLYNQTTGAYIKGYVAFGDCGNSGAGFEGSIFSIDDSYNSSTDTFTIKTTWPNINGHGTDQQLLYYHFQQ